MSAPLARFAAQRKVRFAECDPAGIVFYPRYFEYLNGLVEDWFEAIGFPFHETHIGGRIGTPVRALEAEFLRSSRLGEVLELSLELLEVGRTSARLEGVFSCAGEERFRARCAIVYVDFQEGPLPWPSEMRAAMTGSAA